MRFVQHFFYDEKSERELCAFVECERIESTAPTLGCHDSAFEAFQTGRMCVVDGSLRGRWYEPGKWETLYNSDPEQTRRDILESLDEFGSHPADYVSECNTKAFICRNHSGEAA